MASVFNSTILPGTFDGTTPLIYLTPHLAHQVNIATYVHIGTTTVLIWDVLNNLRNDFKLLFSFKFGIPTILYFLTRISLLAYSLGRAVILTAPVENCAAFERALNALLIVFVCCTTCFFYIRVCAVYDMNRYIIAFFGTTWLATVAMSITFAHTFTAHRIEPTKYCIEKIQGSYLGPTAAILLFNDVLIYLAITWKVYQIFRDPETTMGQRLKQLVFGMSLPALSRVILQDSQFYCLVIVLTKGFLVITITRLQPPANAMFIICHLVLVNILSCRVYRNIKMSLRMWEPKSSTNLEFEVRGRNGSIHRYDGHTSSSGTITFRENSPNRSISRHSDVVLDMRSTSSRSIRDSVVTDSDEKRTSVYITSSNA